VGNFSKKLRCISSLVSAILVSTVGCSTVPMEVKETRYFMVTNGENTNYYRLHVFADTRLGVSEYRSGWFPADAVDSVFGDVSETGSTAALSDRREIEALVRAAIKETYQNWLEAAKKPNASIDKLQKLMDARRRVLAFPVIEGEPFPNSVEIEYNPSKGISLRHADEKLVFILSSNPNEVVGKIANFAQSRETTLSIQHLGNIIAQRNRNQLIEQEAKNTLDIKVGKVIVEQIDDTVLSIDNAFTSGLDPDPGDVLRRVESLDTLLKTLN
jgi:predicted component of type VI protein secretion system